VARIKIRRIKHKFKKEFGYPEDKWARGGGTHGYARSYGHNSARAKPRTKAEVENDRQRKAVTSSQDRADKAMADM